MFHLIRSLSILFRIGHLVVIHLLLIFLSKVDGLDEADMEVEMIFNQAVNKHRFTIGRDEHIDVVDSLSRMSMDNEDIYMFNSQVR